MRSSRALALVVILAAFGCGPSESERAMQSQLEQIKFDVAKMTVDAVLRTQSQTDALAAKLDALATPPTTIKAPEGAFWLGPRECPTDAPCAITLFFGQGKPADLQLVPYVPQGAPAVPVARPPAK